MDLESRCSTASTQAAQEERRLEAVRSELAAARTALETEVGDTRRALQQEVSAARQAVDVEVVAQRRAFEAETSHRRAELQRTKEAVMVGEGRGGEGRGTEGAAACRRAD